MKYRHDLERWHKTGEFAKELVQMADIFEIREIRKCIHYEFDNQSAEEYCYHPSKRGEYGAAHCLNGMSKEVCWQCELREKKKNESRD